MRDQPESFYHHFGKRFFDIVFAIGLLIFLSPALILVAVLVKFFIGSPIFFKQIRPGKNGKPFGLVKFRTMTNATDANGDVLKDSLRLTGFGEWLRKSSLDELPELWNILCGDMSFVGPRPLLMEYLKYYNQSQNKRHTVKPGLTGLAQINGRNNLSWEEKFEFDIEYIEKYNFLFDVRIISKTILKVLLRDGVNPTGAVSVKRFDESFPVAVIGAGGHAKMILSVLLENSSHIKGCYEDDSSKWSKTIFDVPIVGPVSKVKSLTNCRSIVAVGDNAIRESLVQKLPEVNWLTAISNLSSIHKSVGIGEGTVVAAGAVLQPASSIGKHVIINTGATLDHDVVIRDFVSIGPNATLSGGVVVGPLCMLGAGCIILPGVTIGEKARIGAGAVVTKNVRAGDTVVGCPAKPVPSKNITPSLQPSLSKAPWPYFGKDETNAVNEVLTSGKVNYWTGDEGRKFENEFATYLGVEHAIAVANGTVAIELALNALGVGVGDEVIVPSCTFIASASAVAVSGAKPVFADIDPLTRNIRADTIRPLISTKTKAIVVVHLGGLPCEMDEIMSLAKAHSIFVVEDCAQAHGATYKGKPVGSIGDINAFSFCQDKILTTGGEGGLVTTNDHTLWKKAWSFKDHGKCREAMLAKGSAGCFRYIHTTLGTNYRMTEMQAAIGRKQLGKLVSWSAQRNENAEILKKILSRCSILKFPYLSENCSNGFYRLYASLEIDKLALGWSRDRIVSTLQQSGYGLGTGSCGEIYREKAMVDFWDGVRLHNAKLANETSIAFLVHPGLEKKYLELLANDTLNVISTATKVQHDGVCEQAA